MISQVSLRSSTRSVAVPNVLRQCGLHMAKTARSEGATTGAKTGFSEKEKAEESRWARSHDSDLLKQLRDKLAQQEKDTNELRAKLNEFEKRSNNSQKP
ncbi:hypothetical protein BDF20DRAFT_891878 [Mycotypha africana]|uniref:uncharacterized protein n=1 Tax=Mycotypha africana TaxID=64632 RepID=UPI0023001EC3|nr:uncharacterized protein BDF20DRAFT_891878 [Mycotypha africana]KAI8968869.1 hypothetical protein BDF20DRAFT_891878 [Mycotypha africana]